MRYRKVSSAALIVAAIGTGLTGCAQPGAYDGQQGGLGRTGGGAVLGALGGAALGALTGDDAVERRQRALIGAGIGAVAGGGVGYYMDRQERQFRQELANTPVEVQRVQETIVLTVPSSVSFASDSSTLLPAAQSSLDEVANILTSNPQTTIDVVGYTDSTGDENYNLRLSEQRARAVANYLTSRGVRPERILVTGQGEASPIASNQTAEGRAANRRVEIRVNPLRQPGV